MNTKQKEAADESFKAGSNIKEVFVTTDGQAFVSENSAKLHANHNASGKKLTYDKFVRGVKNGNTEKKVSTKKTLTESKKKDTEQTLKQLSKDTKVIATEGQTGGEKVDTLRQKDDI